MMSSEHGRSGVTRKAHIILVANFLESSQQQVRKEDKILVKKKR
jgi:hypothetical protein